MSWVSVDQVAEALGPSADSDDPFLGTCTDAANSFAFRRRAQAGYHDDPDLAPGPDASLGTVLYAVALYRERGSVDSFASFDEFAVGVMPSSSMGQVLRLLGTPKPQVDRRTDDLVAAPFRYRGIR